MEPQLVGYTLISLDNQRPADLRGWEPIVNRPHITLWKRGKQIIKYALRSGEYSLWERFDTPTNNVIVVLATERDTPSNFWQAGTYSSIDKARAAILPLFDTIVYQDDPIDWYVISGYIGGRVRTYSLWKDVVK